MINKLTTLLKFCFFLGLVLFLTYKTALRPRVLVVQSYTNEYPWTRDIDKAIHQVLDEKFYDVRYFYMDTKKHSDAQFKKIAGASVRKQIDDWSPNVLIAIDDNAQSLVSSCYVDPDKLAGGPGRRQKLEKAYPDFGKCYRDHQDMVVIFAGIGATPEHYGFDNQPNIGGITERMDILALRDALEKVKLSLNKANMKIVLPVDISTSSTLNIEHSFSALGRVLEPLNIDIEHKAAATWPRWKQNLAHARANTDDKADLLLFTTYHTVKCDNTPGAKRIAPRQLMHWTLANAEVPAMGAWGFFVEDGGQLSIGVSPFEQGEVSARLAVDYLDRGILPGTQPVYSTRQSIIYMRENREKHQGFSLPIIYQNFARATDNYIQVCQSGSAGCLEPPVEVPDLDAYCSAK